MRKVGVVSVIPRNESVGSLQKGFGFFIVTISFFRVLREHRDYFEQSS